MHQQPCVPGAENCPLENTPTSANPPSSQSAGLQFLTAKQMPWGTPSAAKNWGMRNGRLECTQKFDKRLKYVVREPRVPIPDIQSLYDALKLRSKTPTILISDAFNASDERVIESEKKGRLRRTAKEGVDQHGAVKLPCWIQAPVDMVPHDFDPSLVAIEHLRSLGADVFNAPEQTARLARDEFLEAEFAECDLVYQYSSSAGINENGELDGAIAKIHFFSLMQDAIELNDLKTFILRHNATLQMRGFGPRELDPSLCDAVHLLYIKDPEFDGCPDPIPERWGILPGKHRRVAIKIENVSASENARELPRKEPSRVARTRNRVVPLGAGTAAWDKDWRSHFLRLGDGREGFHDPIRASTYYLGSQLVEDGIVREGMSIDQMREAAAPYLAEIETAAIAAPRTRSLAAVQEETSRLWEYTQKPILRALADRAIEETAPHFPDTAVSLAAGEAARDAIFDWWLSEAILHHERRFPVCRGSGTHSPSA